MSATRTLAICIPTYRRPEMLRRCVLSAIESAGSRPISIFIADDSISDINQAVLEDLRGRYSFVRWHRNETNLGIDLNIQHVLTLSDCDYAWLIGEDDQFLPGAVAHVWGLIQTHSYPFLFSNYQYVNDDHSRVVGVALPNAAEGAEPAPRFIEACLWSVGFIGSCVLQREAWLRTESGPYYGTYFTHVGRVVEMLARQPELYVAARPAVSNRAQGDETFTWKKDSFGVFLGFERMCEVAATRNPVFAESLRKAAVNYRRKFAYFSVKTTFRLRSEGAFDWRQYRVYIKGAEIEPWRKAWMCALAVTPSRLLKPLALAYIAYAARRTRRNESAGVA